MTNLREGDKGDESLADAISRITSFKTHNSVRSSKHSRLITPNFNLSVRNERKPRELVEKIDGIDRYSKRMNIQGKDLHTDSGLKSNFRKGLQEQVVHNHENLLNRVQQRKDEDSDLISQIKETLKDATSKKQNLLYKQRN